MSVSPQNWLHCSLFLVLQTKKLLSYLEKTASWGDTEERRIEQFTFFKSWWYKESSVFRSFTDRISSDSVSPSLHRESDSFLPTERLRQTSQDRRCRCQDWTHSQLRSLQLFFSKDRRKFRVVIFSRRLLASPAVDVPPLSLAFCLLLCWLNMLTLKQHDSVVILRETEQHVKLVTSGRSFLCNLNNFSTK